MQNNSNVPTRNPPKTLNIKASKITITTETGETYTMRNFTGRLVGSDYTLTGKTANPLGRPSDHFTCCAKPYPPAPDTAYDAINRFIDEKLDEHIQFYGRFDRRPK